MEGLIFAEMEMEVNWDRKFESVAASKEHLINVFEDVVVLCFAVEDYGLVYQLFKQIADPHFGDTIQSQGVTNHSPKSVEYFPKIFTKTELKILNHEILGACKKI